MGKNYLVMDDLDNVVELKNGDVIVVESLETGITGVAMVADVNYEHGFINLSSGINSTGRVYYNMFVPVNEFVCMATDAGKKRLSNAINAMVNDCIKDAEKACLDLEEAGKKFAAALNEAFEPIGKSVVIKINPGAFVRCYDGITTFTAKITDISKWKEGKLKAITPHKGYGYNMIDISSITRFATENEIVSFQSGMGL